MTKPKASREENGKRYYPIPLVGPAPRELMSLPGVSRIESVLFSYGLERWKLTTVAEQLAKQKDLAILATTDPVAAYKQALDAGRKSANVGTSVHSLTEQYDEGILDMDLVSDAVRPWVESYAMAKEAYGWEVLHQECTVFNHALGYAGTLDRICKMTYPGEEGIFIVDIKTGRDVYRSSSAQLALYANAEGIWEPPSSCPKSDALYKELQANIDGGTNVPTGRRGWSDAAQKAEKGKIDAVYWQEFADTGTFLPMPKGLRTDRAFLLHLFDKDPATKASRPGVLRPLRLDKELPGALSFLYHWDNDSTILGPALPVVGAETKPTNICDVSLLVLRARSLLPGNRQALAKVWPADLPSLKQPERYTAELMERAEQLIAEAEAAEKVEKVFKSAKPNVSALVD